MESTSQFQPWGAKADHCTCQVPAGAPGAMVRHHSYLASGSFLTALVARGNSTNDPRFRAKAAGVNSPVNEVSVRWDVSLGAVWIQTVSAGAAAHPGQGELCSCRDWQHLWLFPVAEENAALPRLPLREQSLSQSCPSAPSTGKAAASPTTTEEGVIPLKGAGEHSALTHTVAAIGAAGSAVPGCPMAGFCVPAHSSPSAGHCWLSNIPELQYLSVQSHH